MILLVVALHQKVIVIFAFKQINKLVSSLEVELYSLLLHQLFNKVNSGLQETLDRQLSHLYIIQFNWHLFLFRKIFSKINKHAKSSSKMRQKINYRKIISDGRLRKDHWPFPRKSSRLFTGKVRSSSLQPLIFSIKY